MLSREQLEDVINCENIDCESCSFMNLCVGAGATETATELAENSIVLMNKIENREMEIEKLEKEIEQLEKFKQDSLGLIQRHEKLKERHATMMEKAQEFIELYEAGPCDFVGEVPSLMDLHHRYYCMFKDIYTVIGGGQ